MKQLPHWPDQPALPTQPPGHGSPPALFWSRSQLALAAVAVVSGFLTVALLGVLALVLSNSARGATLGGQAQSGQTGQTGQTGQNGQNGQPRNGQAATAGTGGGSGTLASSSGAGTGTGATQPNTSGRGTLPTPPGTAVAVGCCLTLGPSVHQVANQATLSGTSAGPVVATCPAGEIALSGGWSIPPHAGALVYLSGRHSAQSWSVYVRHGSSVDVTTYAECLANAPGATIVERVGYGSVSPGTDGFAHANCNAGEVVVGGGFASQTGVVVYLSQISTTDGTTTNAWADGAKNLGATSGQLRVYAECLTYANAHSSQTAHGESGTEIAPGNGGRAASPPCPSGTYLSGGSFFGPAGTYYDMSAAGSGSSITWAVYDYNNLGDQHSAFVGSAAMCLGF
jgi:hypothetical protein